VSVLPVGGSVHVDKVYGHPELRPLCHEFDAEVSSGSVTLRAPMANILQQSRFTPILRGGQRRHSSDGHGIIGQRIFSDGLVDFVYKHTDKKKPLFRSWVLGLAANALLVADTMRVLGGSPGAELIVDVELRADYYASGIPAENAPFKIGGWGESEAYWRDAGPNPLRLPMISATERSEFPAVLWTISNDLLNAVGFEDEGKFEINLD